MIAAGAVYRKLSVPGIERFEGAGVYYSATAMERRLCGTEEVVVVGGGNSAGQAAVFLSGHARKVLMIIRGGGLGASMSRYLIERIEATPFPIHRGTRAIPVTVSIGVAAREAGDTAAGEMLKRADLALYRAKQQGRNRVIAAAA